MPTLRSFGPSSTIQVGRISPGPGGCTACPSCLRVLCTCLRVPCLRSCVFQPACVDRYHVPARACGVCAGPLSANTLRLFAWAFPVPARVLCLPWSTSSIAATTIGGGLPPSLRVTYVTMSIDVRITPLMCLDSFTSTSSFLTYLPPHVHFWLRPNIHTYLNTSSCPFYTNLLFPYVLSYV